mgnify:CR=1 FL=1
MALTKAALSLATTAGGVLADHCGWNTGFVRGTSRAKACAGTPQRLGEVVGAIDKLFTQRFDALVNSMQLGKPPRGYGGQSGHGGPRKPRHLH